MARPCSLDRSCYTGLFRHFVTACTRDRQKAFTEHDFCATTVNAILACAATHRFAVSAYCLMPDHAHLLVRAEDDGAELRGFLAAWRQRSGFAWSERSGSRLWQRGYWDRTLRAEDELLPIARYVLENPVRAGLVAEPRAYPWSGSSEFAIEQILDAAQIDLWRKWKR